MAKQGHSVNTAAAAQPEGALDPVEEAAALLGSDFARLVTLERGPRDTGLNDPTAVDLDQVFTSERFDMLRAAASFKPPSITEALRSIPKPPPLRPRALRFARPKPITGPSKPIIAEPEPVLEPEPVVAEPVVAEPVAVAEPVVVAVPVAEPVAIAKPVAVPVPIAKPIAVAEPVPVAVAEPVAIAKPAPVAEPVVIAEAAVAQPVKRATTRPPRLTAPVGSGLAPPSEPPLDLGKSIPSVILNFDNASAAVTNVFHGVHAAPQPRARLVVTSGPNTGKTWYLNRAVTTLGRGQGNDIVVSDVAVSRTHLRVERHREGFRLVDLSGANGVWINGAKVTQQELYDGDRILLGSLRLSFSMVGEPREREAGASHVTDPGRAVPSPRWRVPKSWIVIWVITTVLAMGVTVGVTHYQQQRQQAATEAQLQVAQAEASSAMDRRAWDQARAALLTAQALDPEALDFEAQFAQITRAQRHEGLLSQAQAVLSQGGYVQVAGLLAPIDDQSPYAVDARGLRRRAQALQKKREREERAALRAP